MTHNPQSALLVVYSDCIAGRADDFNEWYSKVHIRDVMRIRGSHAVQRFVRDDAGQPQGVRPPGPGPFLAIYEVRDVDTCIDVHLDACTTERMPIGDSLDAAKSEDTFYVPLDEALDPVDSTVPPGDDGVVLIAFNGKVGREPELVDWNKACWQSALHRVAGLGAGHLYVKHTTQLMEMGQRRYVGIYQVNDWERARWSLADALTQFVHDSPIDAEGCQWARYTALIPRLTAAEVKAASAEQHAEERRARERLGSGLLHFSLREVRKQLGMPDR